MFQTHYRQKLDLTAEGLRPSGGVPEAAHGDQGRSGSASLEPGRPAASFRRQSGAG
jgi:hypothetical protein